MFPLARTLSWTAAFAAGLGLLGPRLCRGESARQLAAARTMMVESEVAAAGVKHPAILAAMRTVPRHEFIPAELRAYAYQDMALPIGEGQTISPPFVVAWMTEQLDPQPEDRVLEIGTGSGYHAAVISRLVQHMCTIEINPVLAEKAKKTFTRVGYDNIEARLADGYQGWAEHAPFDKIIVTCSPERVPTPLAEQLREGGRMVIPLGERYQQTLYVLVKRDGKLKVQSREPTFFVPMTGRAESLRSVASSEAVSDLGNGDFEKLLQPNKPDVWYYVRQAAVAEGGPSSGSKHYLAFTNQVPGRGAQALQAIGVDGRQISELVVELAVKGQKIEPADTREEQGGARLLINFFDEGRNPLGLKTVGPWRGSFNWKRQTAHLQVPPTARVGIVVVGLLGSTGEFDCDEIRIRPAGGKIANRAQ